MKTQHHVKFDSSITIMRYIMLMVHDGYFKHMHTDLAALHTVWDQLVPYRQMYDNL